MAVSRLPPVLPKSVGPEAVEPLLILFHDSNLGLGVDYKGHDLISCSNVTNTDTSFCCDGVEDCCNSGVGRMDIQPPNAGIWAAWNSASDGYVVRTPLPTKVSSTSSSTSTSATEEAETSAVSTTSTAGSNTPTDTASGQAPDDQSGQSGQLTNGDDSSTASSGLSTGAQVGIGVGAAAGAILLAAVAFLWWKYKRLQAQMAGAGAGASPEQGQYYPANSYYPQDPYHSELAAEQKRQELYGGGPRLDAAELPGHAGLPPSVYADSPVMGR